MIECCSRFGMGPNRIRVATCDDKLFSEERELIVAEQRNTTGDKTTTKKVAINENVLNLFADTPRLLEYFRIFTTPCSKIRVAQRSKRNWGVPRGTKFPVAFYDKRHRLQVFENEPDLKKSLAKLPGVRQVILYEVPVGARFVWVEFGWGTNPKLLNPKASGSVKLNQHVVERVAKTWRMLFADVPRFRVAFSVGTDNQFKLMNGVIIGYR